MGRGACTGTGAKHREENSPTLAYTVQQSFTETKAFRAGFLLLPVYANDGAKEAKVVAEHGNGWQNADVLEPA
jgi:hypothetical protein